MLNTVITLEDFVKYYEMSTESISEEFPDGTTKLKLSIRLPMINGHKGLREIIPHIWNFNTAIQGKAVTEDQMKSLFAASLTGNTRGKWNVVVYPTVVPEDDPRTFCSAAEALVTLYVQDTLCSRQSERTLRASGIPASDQETAEYRHNIFPNVHGKY